MFVKNYSMHQPDMIYKFTQLVLNKYHLYNGLFLKLPYEQIAGTGMLLPILTQYCRQGLEAGRKPVDIVDGFFERFTDLSDESEKINFLFKVIQYVERQVVLFDSIEDASFEELNAASVQQSLKDMYIIASASGKQPDWYDFLRQFSVRIVFTAHPTQFYPPAVQHIIHDLEDAIQADDVNAIDELLQQLGQTPFVNREKPSPLDEAKSIIYYLRNVYYHAIGEMYAAIEAQFAAASQLANYDLFRLGFWPGGDRDGNPFVTRDITRQVAWELKTTLFKCYYHELKALRRRITFHQVSDILQELSGKLYINMFDPRPGFSHEDILKPLEEVSRLLHEKYHGLYAKELHQLITRVHIFKSHFATIDIRQDARMHEYVIDAIAEKYKLCDQPFSGLDFDTKMKILSDSSVRVDVADFEDPIVTDTILTVGQIREIQSANGEEGCNRYIISNAEDVFSVLNVYALFRWCDYKAEDIHVDIVPLFETIAGLSQSSEIMAQLYQLPAYAQHLRARGNKQTIMLGFSDGTKDGGYLKANWEIFKTKENLSRISQTNGITVVFFDGRGGPPARGGGKTQRFYASQGKNIANEEIQLTIQGQTITSMYGTQSQFRHNCEQLLLAGASNHLLDLAETHLSTAQRALMEELADLSYEKYTALKNHPQFLPYLEKMSALKYYGKTNIGSRPGKRGDKAKLEFEDLRAISFVGAWSQLKQNVPGYFGIGAALQQLKEAGRLHEATALYQQSSFFKTLVLNSMMSLEKCYFPLTAFIKDVPEFSAFWSILFDEYELSKQLMLEISGQTQLMEEEILSKASIDIREDIVLPLLTIQQYALQKTSLETPNKEVYEKLITRSLFGNINASRNSA
jgi:phosphoenolpyruvate carboxylase